jgi:hypothetical protein
MIRNVISVIAEEPDRSSSPASKHEHAPGEWIFGEHNLGDDVVHRAPRGT